MCLSNKSIHAKSLLQVNGKLLQKPQGSHLIENINNENVKKTTDSWANVCTLWFLLGFSSPTAEKLPNKVGLANGNDPKFSEILEEQSDQGLHCLLLHLHLFDEILEGLASFLEFR